MNTRAWSRRCAHIAIVASVSAVAVGAAAAAGRPLVARRAHHVLFAVTSAASLGSAALAPSRRRVLPLLPLAVLPRTRAGTPVHAGTGVTAAALVVVASFGL